MTSCPTDTGEPFAHLTRDQLERRLRAAEDVCLLSGWGGTIEGTERSKATTQLWMRWAEIVGDSYLSPKVHPELIASESSLARQRDAIRERTLRKIRGES